MKKHTLSATPRDLVGHKVKKLRVQGLVPATIYGKKIKSVSIAVKLEDFNKTYKEAGESGLIELILDKETHPVLIHNLQVDPIRGNPLHVEFYQVDLKEKVHTKVPLEFSGEPLAVANKIGVLLTITDEVEVEALPTDLPERFILDVSTLAEIDAELKVANLKAASGVTIITDRDITLVKIGALISKEAEKQAAEEAAAAAATEAAKAEAPATAEGAPEAPSVQAPAEEKKEEANKE